MGTAEDQVTSLPHDPLAPVSPSVSPVARRPRLVSRAHTMLRQREVRRLTAFLLAGGVSALVTITTTALLVDVARIPFIWAAIIGTELGILVNFSVNDRFAFHDLSGHKRSLVARLLRFHLTCALGQTLILLLSLLLHDGAHWRSVFAQALPIGLVTCVNFVMHRFWTYRDPRSRPSP